MLVVQVFKKTKQQVVYSHTKEYAYTLKLTTQVTSSGWILDWNWPAAVVLVTVEVPVDIVHPSNPCILNFSQMLLHLSSSYLSIVTTSVSRVYT